MKDFWNSLRAIFRTLTEKYPFFAYFLLAILVCWPISFGIYALQYDAVDVYLPWRFFGSESLRQGIMPLWNPYQDGGYPFYADHQYSIWNPELFLVSLFTRYNASTLTWLYLFYLSIGAMGFRFLLKTLKLNRSVWFVGGVIFMFSGVMIGHAQSVISVLGAVWLPWAIGAYIKALDDGFQKQDVLRVILFMFLMLAGGYQAVSIMLFYLVLALGGYKCVNLISSKDWSSLKRFLLGHLIVGLSIGVLLAGVVLSMIEVFPYLSRLAGISLEDSQLVHFHPDALWSFFFPLATAQDEYQGTSLSAQNIFIGVTTLFALIYAFKRLKSRMNPTLIILMLFGVLYGLAAFGPYTPIQSILYKYLPGCNQFYYASFYRYFTLITLLILICFGIQEFLEWGKVKHLVWFLIGSVVLFIGTAIAYWSNWDLMDYAVSHTWAATFRKLEWGPAILLESIVHAVLFGLFLFFMIKKRSPKILLVFIILEMGIITQLNLPITVNGEIKTATLDNYLDTKREGFITPQNDTLMGYYDQFGKYASIWRNQGNFTNIPCLDGFTSFHLSGKEKVMRENDSVQELILNRPQAYLLNHRLLPTIKEFVPNKIRIALPNIASKDTLVLQQAKFEHWKIAVDGKEIKPSQVGEVNEFEMMIEVPSGAKEITFDFDHPVMTILYYISSFGFLIVLLLYGVGHFQWSAVRQGSVFSIAFILIAIRFFSFTPTPSEGYTIIKGAQKLNFKTNLLKKEHQEVYAFANNTDRDIKLMNHNMDDDPRLLSILAYLKPDLTENGADLIFKTGKNIIDTVRNDIPPRGFHNIDLETALAGKEQSGYLCFGFDLHEVKPSKDLFVVIELKEEDRLLYYHAFPMSYFWKNQGRTSYTNGYLLPALGGKRHFKMYLWNNSDNPFTFSNFSLQIID